MRFKPPTPNSSIGWRVEFRSMDIQLTDHENTAYSVFIVLLAKTISYFDLNFYIPISKVDENMQLCQKRDAVMSQQFWFRNYVSSGNLLFLITSLTPFMHLNVIDSANKAADIRDEYSSQSIAQIMNGDGQTTGICTWIDRYISAQSVSESTQNVLKAHVNLIRERALGIRQTGATWIRDFVTSHPAYKKDSVVSHEINYDLIQKILTLDSDEMVRRL